jgi:hypothetical protein
VIKQNIEIFQEHSSSNHVVALRGRQFTAFWEISRASFGVSVKSCIGFGGQLPFFAVDRKSDGEGGKVGKFATVADQTFGDFGALGSAFKFLVFNVGLDLKLLKIKITSDKDCLETL